MTQTDRARLQDAAEHLVVMHQHLAETGADDQLVIDAAALRLSAAIDSVASVPDTLRQKVITDDSWRAIKGMRNRIAHAYAFFDPAVLRSTLDRDVTGFEADVHRLIALTAD